MLYLVHVNSRHASFFSSFCFIFASLVCFPVLFFVSLLLYFVFFCERFGLGMGLVGVPCVHVFFCRKRVGVETGVPISDLKLAFLGVLM